MDSSVFISISAGDEVGLFNGAVQAFDELFEGAEFFGDFKSFASPMTCVMKTSQSFSILNCWAARGYALYPSAMNFRDLPGNSLNLSKAMRMVRMQDPTSRKYGAGHLVHDEPDIGFYAFDFDVGHIGSQLV